MGFSDPVMGAQFIMVRKGYRQEHGEAVTVASATVHSKLETESNESLCLACLFPFIQARAPAHGTTHIHLSTLDNACPETPSSKVILNPIKLTVTINNHTSIRSLKVKTVPF